MELQGHVVGRFSGRPQAGPGQTGNAGFATGYLLVLLLVILFFLREKFESPLYCYKNCCCSLAARNNQKWPLSVCNRFRTKENVNFIEGSS